MRTNMFQPMINNVSLQLLMPIVSPRYAAIQVLDAIEWNRQEVILPYRLKYIGLINDLFFPQWLSEWLLFQVSGRRPLDNFPRDNEDNLRKRKVNPNGQKDKIDLI